MPKNDDKEAQNQHWWLERDKRNLLYQFLALTALVLLGHYFYSNTQHNLERQNIATGFGFLNLEAGFEISDTLIEYWSDDTYRKALWVGVLNTLKVALIGNVLAVVFGVLIGVGRLSSNWLVSRGTQCFIEVVRNVPLLLQLFFWYALFTEVFPPIKQAWEFLPHTFLSQRGLVFPVFATHAVWGRMFLWAFLFFLGFMTFRVYARKKREQTGKPVQYLLPSVLIFVVVNVLLWWVGGAPTKLDYPELAGFNFRGGYYLSPEFITLMLGLVIYTSAFIGEIVRAGILAVPRGQWEAARSLGLSEFKLMRLIVLPQALRVIVPPLTSQMLNLVKNSSLAIGIGYPDFVAVANTTMNQTGQAIELVALIMLMYLAFSLSISVFMNLYNRSIALKGKQ